MNAATAELSVAIRADLAAARHRLAWAALRLHVMGEHDLADECDDIGEAMLVAHKTITRRLG